MPKNNKVSKHDGNIFKQKVPAKLRIGTRKSGKSAIAMSSAELQAVLESNDKRKWHYRARKVLRQRGIV
jgi:hypothetical protein